MARLRISSSLVAVGSFVALAACPSPAAAPAPCASPSASASPTPVAATIAIPPVDPCLTIVGWNDVHGQIAPDLPLISTGRVPAGGVVAMADALDDIRHEETNVVVLDAGDEFTGPLESSLAEGAPITIAFNLMHVDAATLGNHEFDFGPVGYERIRAAEGVGDEAGKDGPRGALLARLSEAKFPYVNANLRRVGGGELAWKDVSPSTIVARGDWRVGVVGYTTRDTPTTTLKPSVVGLDFATDAAKNVATEIKKLRASGAAPIVLLAHASIDSELPQKLDDPRDPHGDARKGEMADLIAALGDDVPDLIIGGHRHAWMIGRVRGVPMVTSDQHGVGMSRSRFCRATPTSTPALQSIERVVPLANDPPRTDLGRKVAAAMKPWLDAVKTEAEAIVTELPKACVAQSLDGTAMMEQLARAILEHVADAKPAPRQVPVVAFNNAGGLRAPFAQGPLHFADLYESFPFENAVAVCGTTRKGLLHAIGNALKKPSVRERMPFGLAGATLHVKRRDDGGLDFVSIAFAKGKADHDDDPVWLALPDFLLWGGDGFLDGVTCTPAVGSQTRMRDAWRGVLEREKKCDGPATSIVVDHPKK